MNDLIKGIVFGLAFCLPFWAAVIYYALHVIGSAP